MVLRPVDDAEHVADHSRDVGLRRRDEAHRAGPCPDAAWKVVSPAARDRHRCGRSALEDREGSPGPAPAALQHCSRAGARECYARSECMGADAGETGTEIIVRRLPAYRWVSVWPVVRCPLSVVRLSVSLSSIVGF